MAHAQGPCTPLKGIYTLGGMTADFSTFTEFSDSINLCGIDSHVVVMVNPGTYNDRLILDHVAGTNVNATITVDGSNASLVTLANSTFSNVYLNGTDWTTIRNMTLENLATSDAYGVQLRDSAFMNVIEHCVINLNPTATSLSDVIGVSASNSETDDFAEGQNAFRTTVRNCQINGGEMGIHFEGEFGDRNVGNSFIDNVLDLGEDYGIFIDEQDSLLIHGNVITNLRASGADGISIDDIVAFEISENQVIEAPDKGMEIDDANFDATSPTRGLIVNNMISANTDNAMDLDDIEDTDIWHNTCLNTSGIQGAFKINDMVNLDIRNNVFVSETDYAFESTDAITTGNNVIDYNNYWTNGSLFVDDGPTVHTDLASWQAAVTTANVNSVEIEPTFVGGSADLHTFTFAMDDLGDNSVGVATDIDGETRPAGVNVDLGADEFTPIADDAGLIALTANPTTPGNGEVVVTLQNFGFDTLQSATISWEINGVAQTPFSWTGLELTDSTDVVNLGGFVVPAGIFEVKTWTSLPNGNVDPNNANDTLTATFCLFPLAGVYTLGGGGADFATFADLSLALQSCGIDSHVVVNVAPGTYNERFILEHVNGTADTATITVDGGSAGLVTISNSVFSNVYFNGADWTTIKNMTLENTGTNDAYGVQLRDSASFITIDSCVIKLDSTNTGLTDVIGVNASNTETSDASEGLNAFRTTVSNTVITGGEMGIHYEGQSSNRNIGNSFVNNVIDQAEDYGIFIDDQDSLLIRGNVISNLRASGADGISIDDIVAFEISSNSLLEVPDKGMEIDDANFDATSPTRGLIVNNMISSNSDNAMDLDDIEDTDIWHNSCLNTSGTQGTFKVNDMVNLDIRNNVFASETDFAFESTDAITTGNNTINYNNYWSNGANLVDDGPTVHADLAAWQAAVTSANVNSIEVDPAFVGGAADLHTFSGGMNDMGDNTVGVNIDIDGDSRPAGPSVDPGADEYTPLAINATLLSVLASDCGLGPHTVTLEFVNGGVDTLFSGASIPVGYLLNGTLIPDTIILSSDLIPGDTLTHPVDSAFTASNPGQFNVVGFVNLAGDQFTGDDSLALSLNLYPVVTNFPYEEDFSTGQNGWAIDNTVNGSWEFGNPAKAVIMGGSGDTSAFVTSLTGLYNNNENSWVESPCFDFSGMCSPVIALDVWWEAENSFDGAVLQSSIDNGLTWQNVGADGDSINWFNDNTINGNPGGQQEGWTGRNGSGSGGWVTAVHKLDGLDSISSVKLRIAFGTDVSVPDDGFAFDNIHIYDGVDLGEDITVCSMQDSVLLSALGTDATDTLLWSTGATTRDIWGFPNNTYTLSINTATGCSFQDTVTVQFLNVDLGPDTVVCDTAYVLNTGLAGNSYTWSTGDSTQSITVTTSGTYHVTVTAAAGCTSVDTVVVDLFPSISVDLGPDTAFCAGDVNLSLDAGAGFTYLWSDNSTNQTLAVTAGGTYFVEITNSNGCSATDTMVVSEYALPMVNLGNDTAICAGDINLNLDAGAGFTYLWSDNSTNQTLAVTTGGTYSVAITDSNGCVSNDNIVIVENPLPVVNLGNDTAICAGDINLTLDAGIGFTYLWSDNTTNQTLTVTTGGNYFVVITDGNGCSGSDTIVVTENPLPVADLGPDTNTCAGDVVLDPGAGFSAYLWSDNSTDPTLTVGTPGNYSVTVTDANGCTGVDTVFVDDCVSIRENFLQNFTLFPNPSDGNIQLVNGSEAGNMEIKVVNLTGQVVHSERVWIAAGANHSMDLAHLSAGTYVLLIDQPAGREAHRMVIK